MRDPIDTQARLSIFQIGFWGLPALAGSGSEGTIFQGEVEGGFVILGSKPCPRAFENLLSNIYMVYMIVYVCIIDI